MKIDGSAGASADGQDMSSGIEIILWAMLAVFLVARLYKVLGRRTGHERRRDPFADVANDEQKRDKVVPLPERTRPARTDNAPATDAVRDGPTAEDTTDGRLEAGIARIRSADPAFDPGTFMAGVRKAFEMIVNAFAAGDTATLRPLLNDEVFENFDKAIRGRQQANETLQSTLVGISSAETLEADMQGRIAIVTVKIVSEQINVTRDSTGKIVEGDPSTVTTVTDIWTFSRNTRSRDVNWTLIATRSPN